MDLYINPYISHCSNFHFLFHGRGFTIGVHEARVWGELLLGVGFSGIGLFIPSCRDNELCNGENCKALNPKSSILAVDLL